MSVGSGRWACIGLRRWHAWSASMGCAPRAKCHPRPPGRIIRRTSISTCLRLLGLSFCWPLPRGLVALRSLAPGRWRLASDRCVPILCVLPQERCYSPFPVSDRCVPILCVLPQERCYSPFPVPRTVLLPVCGPVSFPWGAAKGTRRRAPPAGSSPLPVVPAEKKEGKGIEARE